MYISIIAQSLSIYWKEDQEFVQVWLMIKAVLMALILSCLLLLWERSYLSLFELCVIRKCETLCICVFTRHYLDVKY